MRCNRSSDGHYVNASSCKTSGSYGFAYGQDNASVDDSRARTPQKVYSLLAKKQVKSCLARMHAIPRAEVHCSMRARTYSPASTYTISQVHAFHLSCTRSPCLMPTDINRRVNLHLPQRPRSIPLARMHTVHALAHCSTRARKHAWRAHKPLLRAHIIRLSHTRSYS